MNFIMNFLFELFKHFRFVSYKLIFAQKMSEVVKSGDLGDQSTLPFHEIHTCWNSGFTWSPKVTALKKLQSYHEISLRFHFQRIKLQCFLLTKLHTWLSILMNAKVSYELIEDFPFHRTEYSVNLHIHSNKNMSRYSLWYFLENRSYHRGAVASY